MQQNHRGKIWLKKKKNLKIKCRVCSSHRFTRLPPGERKMQFRNFRQGKGCKIILFSCASSGARLAWKKPKNAINGLIIHRPATLRCQDNVKGDDTRLQQRVKWSQIMAENWGHLKKKKKNTLQRIFCDTCVKARRFAASRTLVGLLS